MLMQIEGWQQYVKEGGQYLQTAVKGAGKRPDVFTPEILYNLNAIAIEKFLMGYLMYHGDLAENHTMTDLIRAVERHAGPQTELAEKLHYLDSFQEICYIDTYSRKVPTAIDLERILGIGREVRQFVHQEINL
jgi:hypothetical protein